MKRLCVDGPWHGRVIEIPDHILTWNVSQLPEPHYGLVTHDIVVYYAVSGALSGRSLDLFVLSPSQKLSPPDIISALAKAAGLVREESPDG